MPKNKIIANFTGVSVFILVSKALGFLRDILVAKNIGTSMMADMYTNIFSIPNLLFTSIGMALSAVNIPNLTYYMSTEEKEERRKYVNSLFSQIAFFSTLLSVIGIVAAPLIAKIILPGMDEEMEHIAVLLTRVMFPTLVFICLAYVASGVLQVHRHFLLPAIISIPFNILIIASLFVWGENITILGYVTTVGWLLQFLIQLPLYFKEKYSFSFRIDFQNKHIQDIYRQMVPILLGNAVMQISLILDRVFANHLGHGLSAGISYGSNLFITITSVFIVAMSTVAFPDISKYCLNKDFDNVRRLLSYMFKVLFFIFIPYLTIVIMYHSDIIKLVYMRGKFDNNSVEITSTAFLIYSFCLFGYMSQEIFNRVFYALKRYRVPMLLSIVCILLNTLIKLSVYQYYGIAGIAGATVISFTVYAVAMSVMVRKDIGNFIRKDFVIYLTKVLLGAAGMVGVFLAFKMLNMTGVIRALILPLVAGGLIYLLIAYFTKALKDTILRRI